MRRIQLPGTDIETSWLGFGCASLGSRVSARAGLDALHRAHDGGVAWFDVAPAYGAGQAEEILGRFIAGRRHRLCVLTKVGLAPPARAGLMRAAYAVARPAAGLLRGLRGKATRLGTLRNQSLPLTPSLIEGSVATSLRRLGTDHVDVLALHDPDPADVTREEILRALERVIARGQARAVGVAGSSEACAAAIGPGLPYRVVQTAVAVEGDVFARFRAQAAGPLATIGHSVFGVGWHGAPDDALASALRRNPDGVTLTSMFSPDHLAANLANADRAARDLAPSAWVGVPLRNAV